MHTQSTRIAHSLVVCVCNARLSVALHTHRASEQTQGAKFEKARACCVVLCVHVDVDVTNNNNNYNYIV